MRDLMKRRPSPSMVVAMIALFIAASGVASAALKAGTVKSKQIKDGAVRLADLAPNSVNSSKVADGSLTAGDVDASSVQRRIEGACSAGTALGQINQDGTVGCTDTQPTQPAANSVGSTQIQDGAVTPAKLTATPAVKAVTNTGVPAAGPTTPLGLITERFDTDAMHNPASNNSRITANRPGIYLISGSLGWTTAGDDNSVDQISVLVNGTAVEDAFAAQPNDGFNATTQKSETIVRLSAGDYVEVAAYTNDSTAPARNVFATLAATWIGP